jgi:hypothetical protein
MLNVSKGVTIRGPTHLDHAVRSETPDGGGISSVDAGAMGGLSRIGGWVAER